MSSFRFSSLPPELRLQVWKDFLHEETERRIVVINIYDFAAFPMKKHVSPLLIVNRESRQVAKAFYSYTLKVYRTGRRRLLYEKPGWKHNLKEAGILHLSLDQDIFMTSRYWGRQMIEFYEAGSSCSDFKLLRNYTTDSLDAHCHRISRAYTIVKFFVFKWRMMSRFETGRCYWFNDPDDVRTKKYGKLISKISGILRVHRTERPDRQFVLWNTTGYWAICVLVQGDGGNYKQKWLKRRQHQKAVERHPGPTCSPKSIFPLDVSDCACLMAINEPRDIGSRKGAAIILTDQTD
ncbi:hypothetical protein K445DRAFT_304658 [Daldinia sp. EC12]|nr:hypothetical protein K445DRAFT_304658 [Daldinia sp. EC12]